MSMISTGLPSDIGCNCNSMRNGTPLYFPQMAKYGNVSSLYFSPSRFVRVDAGLEYTHLVEKPRFGGDRQKSLQVSFLEGTDNHGVLYYRPSVAAGLELSRRFTINGTASMIRSTTYQDSVVAVDIRVTGISDAR